MKTIKLTLLALSIVLGFSACSSDDDNNNNNNNTDGSTVIFPLNSNNYWKYDVVATNTQFTDDFNGTDSLYVNNANGNNYSLNANDNGIANGIMSSILTSGELTASEQDLTINGTLQLPLAGFVDFTIPLDNVKLYDIQANNNSTLSSVTDSFEQEIQGFPMTFDYTAEIIQVATYESMQLNGENYNNVTETRLTLDVEVSTVLVGQQLNMLNNQEVMAVTAYYANEIGLVRAEADINYEMSQNFISAVELLGGELPIPTSSSGTNVQELTEYFVEE
ncbi:hypothetical protein [Mangrovimonas aestuarii]|uniref:hypothetical protein n=1 Tax=Mangrovimonas aestuarii TaxID=3018443 RepID=UPI00237963B6|nr:hypothetical protein [Mangrovimonas aestuarii]